LGDKIKIMTTTMFVALVLFAVVVAVLSQVKRRAGTGPEEWPYYAKKPLSSPEQVLYWRLNEALPDNIVLAQVALSQLLGVKKGHKFHVWHNRINQLTADFVVCGKDSSVVAVIELDDSTHDSQRRKDTDAKKDKALNAAGIKVVRWTTKELPNGEQIRAQLVAQQAVPADVARPASRVVRRG
jgi:very-short-patch-repair endonuclease